MINWTLSVLKFSLNSSPKDELGAGVLKAWVEKTKVHQGGIYEDPYEQASTGTVANCSTITL